eukprot:TRINITY_DN46829_c0_g1_i1.p1 TRINITY_DN46829_c0_g1~~TRINITY_DN46829_c0_g1_i1.p1  ORF type:complete len:962 (+),score=210.31 TRINITY_DN46829_c0_g1_i1:70-2955(+)
MEDPLLRGLSAGAEGRLVTGLCVQMLDEMGFPVAAVSAAVDAVSSASDDRLQEIAAELCAAHPRRDGVDAPQPLVGSREAGVFSLTMARAHRWWRQDPGGLLSPREASIAPASALSTSDCSIRQSSVAELIQEEPSRRRNDLLSPARMLRSVISGLQRTPQHSGAARVHQGGGRPSFLSQLGLRGPRVSTGSRKASSVSDSGFVPRSYSAPVAGDAGLPRDFAPGAAWARPRGITRQLLRCVRAEARAGAKSHEVGELYRLLTQGRLQDKELSVLLRAVEIAPSARSRAVEPEVDCAICMCSCPQHECVQLECPSRHTFCLDCLRETAEATVLPKCPGVDCKYELSDADVQRLCGDGDRLRRFREAKLRDCIDTMPGLVRCPKEGCTNAVVLEDSERMAWTCDVCGPPAVCSACLEEYHYVLPCERVAQTKVRWQEWMATGRAQHKGTEVDPEQRRQAAEARSAFDAMIKDEQFKMQNCRVCPFCGRTAQKIDGCDSITCGRDAPDKGGGNVQHGCGRLFVFSRAPPYRPKLSDDDLRRGQEAPTAAAASVVHPGTTCAVCSASPIRGIRVECIHCRPELSSRCVDCDCDGKFPQGHDPVRHVCVLHTEGDVDTDGPRSSQYEALLHEADRREAEDNVRRKRRLVIRIVVMVGMVALVCLQVYALFGRNFVKTPSLVECSGPVEDVCNCTGVGWQVVGTDATEQGVARRGEALREYPGWYKTDPPASQYFAQAWLVFIVIVGAVSCVVIVSLILTNGIYDVCTAVTSVYCGFFCVLPCIAFVAVGAGGSRNNLIPSMWALNTTVEPLPPVAHPSTWSPDGDGWCGLLHCDAAIDMETWLNGRTQGSPGLSGTLTAAAVFATVSLLFQLGTVPLFFKAMFTLSGPTDGELACLMVSTCCQFMANIVAWGLLLGLYARSLCDYGWNLADMSRLGSTVPILVVNTFFWLSYIFFALVVTTEDWP